MRPEGIAALAAACVAAIAAVAGSSGGATWVDLASAALVIGGVLVSLVMADRAAAAAGPLMIVAAWAVAPRDLAGAWLAAFVGGSCLGLLWSAGKMRLKGLGPAWLAGILLPLTVVATAALPRSADPRTVPFALVATLLLAAVCATVALARAAIRGLA